jgi:hypothetical protein
MYPPELSAGSEGERREVLIALEALTDFETWGACVTVTGSRSRQTERYGSTPSTGSSRRHHGQKSKSTLRARVLRRQGRVTAQGDGGPETAGAFPFEFAAAQGGLVVQGGQRLEGVGFAIDPVRPPAIRPSDTLRQLRLCDTWMVGSDRLPGSQRLHEPKRTVQLLACTYPHPRNYTPAGSRRLLAKIRELRTGWLVALADRGRRDGGRRRRAPQPERQAASVPGDRSGPDRRVIAKLRAARSALVSIARPSSSASVDFLRAAP